MWKGGVMSKNLTAKPRVSVQALVTERQRNILLREARKEHISLSEVVRRLIEEAIKTAEVGKWAN